LSLHWKVTRGTFPIMEVIKRGRNSWREILSLPAIRCYYEYRALLNRHFPIVHIADISLEIFPYVYRPLDFTFCAVEYCRPGQRVLDMGCGCGIVSILASRKGCSVTAVDINAQAISNTERNCKRNGVSGVNIYLSDLFLSVKGKFNVIICNPPKINFDIHQHKMQSGIAKDFLKRFFCNVEKHLDNHGTIVISNPLTCFSSMKQLAEAHDYIVTQITEYSLWKHPLYLKDVFLCGKMPLWKYVIAVFQRSEPDRKFDKSCRDEVVYSKQGFGKNHGLQEGNICRARQG